MDSKSDKSGGNFFFIIMALVTGNRLFDHFDFQNLKFEKPWLDVLYLFVFVGSIIFLIRNFVNRQSKK